MIEIIFFGRGGQGGVTAAELLAKAAIRDGLYSQAFPFFGTERRGTPVQAFARISDEPIETASHIYEPDIIVVLDPTLLKIKEVMQRLKKGGTLVVNSGEKPVVEGVEAKKLAYVDATSIALKWIGKEIVNTPMLGALLKAEPLVKIESITEEVDKRFGKENVEAVKEAYDKTIVEGS